MIKLDASQLEFCQSLANNIRLLAPAGCGKTISLLHRCRELSKNSRTKQRFLLITFTRAATGELRNRMENDPQFVILKDQSTIDTLNAYGYKRIRNQITSPRLLSTPSDYHFAMKNQLRSAWIGKSHIERAITKPGGNARTLMTLMDNMKSMGFDHTIDTNFTLFQMRLDALESQGLSYRLREQFDLLTRIGVLDSPSKGDPESPSSSRRDFYNRFFMFWREATKLLLEQATFTFEDQKYWTYLDLKSAGKDGKPKPHISGVARYNHVLVDEVQDINPLDLALIKVIVERHRASLTIVGDDDQAIFDWRGATPEYILHPVQYFGTEFKDYQLSVNYRSPENIVRHSQSLIANNRNRVNKKVRAVEGANTAEIDVSKIDDINERLKLVTAIVKSANPGKVAVIGRTRSQLIPFQIYFASDGAPFKTAADLDVFSSKAFDDLITLLYVWDDVRSKAASTVVTNNAIKVCNLIRRRPFSKKDDANMRKHIRMQNPTTVEAAALAIKDYRGPKLSGKTHLQLCTAATEFVTADTVSDAIRAIGKKFDGLSFDFEKAEFDVFYTDPPLKQLAEIAESENLGAKDLINRIEYVKAQIQEYRAFEDYDESDFEERPLHLMTAHRAKGKEFDVVVLLDTVKGIWPYRVKDERDMESERRLFYVAFTRARRKVIMLTGTDPSSDSPFIAELGLKTT